MKIDKQSNYTASNREEVLPAYIRAIDGDVKNLFLLSQGRIRFGTTSDNNRGENISGEWQVFTAHNAIHNEFVVGHGLGAVPQGFIVVNQDLNGSLYQGSTAWASDTVYFKCDNTDTEFSIFLLK